MLRHSQTPGPNTKAVAGLLGVACLCSVETSSPSQLVEAPDPIVVSGSSLYLLGIATPTAQAFIIPSTPLEDKVIPAPTLHKIISCKEALRTQIRRKLQPRQGCIDHIVVNSIRSKLLRCQGARGLYFGFLCSLSKSRY